MSNLQSRLEGNSASVWTHIIRQLSICSREMRRQLSHVSVSFGVSDTEVLLLASLASGGPAGLAQTQLATSVGLSPGQVSGLVERLQACGWIALAPVATDRRRHAWRLTASGTELVHQVWQAFGNEAARWDRQLAADQRQLLGTALNQLSFAVLPEQTRRRSAKKSPMAEAHADPSDGPNGANAPTAVHAHPPNGASCANDIPPSGKEAA